MDTKTTKAELVKGLDDAIADEAGATVMYDSLWHNFTDWYETYPRGTAPIREADFIYLQSQISRIADAEVEHKKTLTALLNRIKALPDG